MITFWRRLTHFLIDRRRVPRGIDEILPWSMATTVHLWNEVCRSDGATLSEYILRSGVNLPAFLLRRRVVVVIAVYSWPLVAWIITRKHGSDSRIHWRRALRRPDLYAAFPRIAFSEQAVVARRSDMAHAIFNAWDYWTGRAPDYAIEDKRVFAERGSASGLPVVRALSLDEARVAGGPFIVKDPTEDMGLGVTIVDDFEELAHRCRANSRCPIWRHLGRVA